MHPPDVQYLSQPLAEILGLAGRELISLVGAGGKTGLMTALAAELGSAGQRVLVTTTTRILRPRGQVILEPDPEALGRRLLDRPSPGEIITLAKAEEASEFGTKLVGLEPAVVDRLFLAGAAEYLLVEADGARRLPLKAPRRGEPPIPRETTLVVGVMGLTGLDRPLDQETVCGLAEFQELSGGRSGEKITPRMAALVAAHPRGLFKNFPPGAVRLLFLNQAEAPGARLGGVALIKALATLPGRPLAGARVVLGSLRTGVMEIFDLE